MGIVKGSSKACQFIGLLFILNCGFCAFAQEINNEEAKLYVVHLGARQHDDHELVAQSHRDMLESVFESAEAARESIIHHYHHGFSGFAAKLTESQAKTLSERPDVFSIGKNQDLQLQSTRVYDYMNVLPTLPKGILHDSDMGSNLVIGFIDSGIWPECPSFNDDGLGPIPKQFKGNCVAGQEFDPAKHCNKKLVGAKYFLEGLKFTRKSYKLDKENIFMSPRGTIGHGTMVASIGASTFVPNVSVKGLAPGIMRGAAPKARIASYKVSWETGPEYQIIMADFVKAYDEAIKDNVDVLSVSIAPGRPPYPPFNTPGEDLELGSFHAVMKGIPVITGSGNAGPDAYTVANIAPWFITTGSVNMDRTFYVDMTLGNNITIMGQAAHTGIGASAGLVYISDYNDQASIMRVAGKVVLTFLKNDFEVLFLLGLLSTEGAKGLIIARPSDILPEDLMKEPVVSIDYEVGYKILRYIRSSSSPTIKITSGKTLVGRPIATTVSGFSCRGPSSQSPAILKPDIVAPGMMILGATTLNNDYTIAQGTSFATPIVAGIVVLLKSIHPDWSPAALKSALMTTASKTDPSGEPIFAEGSPRRLANTFDIGAGLVNAERAKDPGLVYDMNLDDYIHYFCATSYNETAITILTGKPTKCPSPIPSVLDVNYPAITIPDLKEEVAVTRTVTNVGPVDSVYRAVIEPPEGVKIVVEPQTLVFNSSQKKLGFQVRVSSSHKSNSGYFFGSFTWTDGTRNVTIPLSVRPMP